MLLHGYHVCITPSNQWRSGQVSWPSCILIYPGVTLGCSNDRGPLVLVLTLPNVCYTTASNPKESRKQVKKSILLINITDGLKNRGLFICLFDSRSLVQLTKELSGGHQCI